MQGQDIPPSASQSQALAETVVGSFLDRLTAEANKRGGALTIEDLKDLRQEFQKKTLALQAVFEQSFEDYIQTRTRTSWNENRHHPFERTMVRAFSTLFDDDAGLLERNDSLSRRILPGFFMAMNMMLGTEVVDEYQDQCRARVEKIYAVNKDAMDWDVIFDDPEMKLAAEDALIKIAFHFRELNRRAAWFIDLVNNHLEPPEPDGNPDEAAWRFSDAAFVRFLDVLFSNLREKISSEGGRMAITKRYGVDACVDLTELLKGLDAFPHGPAHG